MRSLVPIALLAVSLSAGAQDTPKPGSPTTKDEAAAVDINNKHVAFRKVDTKNYSIEVPKGWDVGEETPFGQREILPSSAVKVETGSAMSSMTGPGLGKQPWEQLYKTSLFYITRFSPDGIKMTATPYKLGKSKLGFECCAWTMNNADGKAVQKLVILKHANGNILALSVKLPASGSTESRSELETMFQRMVDTAVVK